MKSYLHIYQVCALLCITEEITAIFGERRPRAGSHLIYVDDADHRALIHPRPAHVTYGFHHTSPFIEDQFYYDLSKVNKKRPKLKPTLVVHGDHEEVVGLRGLGQLYRQVSSLSSPLIGGFGDAQDEDVKPVKEIIEDDLKYDFRTKTHSIR